MSDAVIRVENLSKKYVINHQEQGRRYKTLRDFLSDGVRSLGQQLLKPGKRRISNPTREEFWALKDVSFEIKRGDRVGIIGRNGAGKSTLLKILSRITEPTHGRISIKGRVASLLEVGTGFHPELTGRENIYLNGAILGMTKAEIRRKFDEIVDFAEIEKFLDTPVKFYSSGMYVRLAFAVAAHLEPEILIVDEVLAVGDVQFQKKCLTKMQDVTENADRTILFVSHNTAAVKQLCDSAILLQNGYMRLHSRTEEALDKYLTLSEFDSSSIGLVNQYGIELLEVYIQDAKSHYITSLLLFNHSYLLRFRVRAYQPFTNTCIVIRIYDTMGSLVSSICSLEEGLEPFTLKSSVEVSITLPTLKLFPGKYRVSIFIYRPNDMVAYLALENVLVFEVEASILKNAFWPYRNEHGIVRISESVTVTEL